MDEENIESDGLFPSSRYKKKRESNKYLVWIQWAAIGAFFVMMLQQRSVLYELTEQSHKLTPPSPSHKLTPPSPSHQGDLRELIVETRKEQKLMLNDVHRLVKDMNSRKLAASQSASKKSSGIEKSQGEVKPLPIAFDCKEGWLQKFFPIPAHEKVTTVEGFDIFVYHGDTTGQDGVSGDIIRNKKWEEKIFLDLPDNSSVLDIGANLCYWTLMWAKHGHRVTAFEPLRTNVNMCAHSICANGFQDQVTLYNIGLGDRVSFCQIWADANNFGDGWTVCDGKSELPIRTDIKMEPRDNLYMFPLDLAYECKDDDPIEYIKIDTEGWILPIIEGGLRTFSCAKKAQIEMWRVPNVPQVLQLTNFQCFNADVNGSCDVKLGWGDGAYIDAIFRDNELFTGKIDNPSILQYE